MKTFQQMLLEQPNIHMQRNEPRHRPYPITKINSQCIIDLNAKARLKILEGDTGEDLKDLGYHDSLDTMPRHDPRKEHVINRILLK